MVQLKDNDNASNIFVNFRKLIEQLGNEQIILEKLPSTIKNVKVITTYNYQSDTKNIEEDDEYFFQEPGKKTAMKISKAYCSKCDLTVENTKTKEKYCFNCGTAFSYKCMNCNKKYLSYASIAYHSYHPCKPIHFCQMKYNYKIKSEQMTIENKDTENSNLKLNTSNNCSKSNKMMNDLDKYICKNIQNCTKEKIVLEYMGFKYFKILYNKKTKSIKRYCTKCNKIEKNVRLLFCQKCKNRLQLQCVKCKRLMLLMKHMYNHIQRCNPIEEYHCSDCELKSRHRAHLRRHIRNKHLKIYSQGDNSQKFQKKKFIKKTKKKVVINSNRMSDTWKINAKAYCMTCKMTVDKNLTEREMCNICGRQCMVQCVTCNKIFSTYESLDRHTKLMHFTEKKFVTCPKCKKKYRNVICLKNHMKFCKTEYFFQCEYCEYTTVYPSNLRSHHYRHHLEEPFNSKLVKKRKRTRKIVSKIDK